MNPLPAKFRALLGPYLRAPFAAELSTTVWLDRRKVRVRESDFAAPADQLDGPAFFIATAQRDKRGALATLRQASAGSLPARALLSAFLVANLATWKRGAKNVVAAAHEGDPEARAKVERLLLLALRSRAMPVQLAARLVIDACKLVGCGASAEVAGVEVGSDSELADRLRALRGGR